MKKYLFAFILSIECSTAFCTDFILQDENDFILQLAAVLSIKILSVTSVGYDESGDPVLCGYKIEASVVDEIYNPINQGSATYEFVVGAISGIEIGNEYMVLTQAFGGEKNLDASSDRTRCLRKEGKDLLVGVPQSLFIVEPFLLRLTSEKWLRASPRNILGLGLKRIGFSLLGTQEDDVSLGILEDHYWISFDEMKSYLTEKLKTQNK